MNLCISARGLGATCLLVVALPAFGVSCKTQGTMTELRTGSETLEDVFVRVVGADHPAETLDWL